MTGQLEVVFMDIATSNPITHYDVTATPTSKPGTSDALGVKASTSMVSRPEQVGDSVTAVLDLEPGTEYAVEVVAVYHNVTLSEKQSSQDVMEAVTYLSPPFFGGGVTAPNRQMQDLLRRTTACTSWSTCRTTSCTSCTG